jgi:hypothetical protein
MRDPYTAEQKAIPERERMERAYSLLCAGASVAEASQQSGYPVDATEQLLSMLPAAVKAAANREAKPRLKKVRSIKGE